MDNVDSTTFIRIMIKMGSKITLRKKIEILTKIKELSYNSNNLIYILNNIYLPFKRVR